MLARVVEEAGLTTVAIAIIREQAEKVKPPRALFVPFAMGFPLGRPNDPELQHRVIASAFDLLGYERGPVLVDFPEEEAPPEILPQASRVPTAPISMHRSTADEVTALRIFYEQWVEEQGGRTAVGLSGIPQRRFRGVVRFLEAYAKGEEADMKERPPDVAVDQFVRYCVDDLKAFHYEARMIQSPDSKEGDLHQWFWGQTAAGPLIVKVAQRMEARGDPTYKSMAFGVSR